MASKKEIKKISDLTPDDKNYNRGTEFGGAIIEKSLRRLGAGRSILLDKKGRIVAGNKTVENAANAGIEDVIVVQTTGKQIVAVQRMDLDLDTKRGREMALADNATSKANLDWDFDQIKSDGWDQTELNEWGVRDWRNLEAVEKVNGDSDEWVGMPEFEAEKNPYKIIISFENEDDRTEFLEQFKIPYFIKKVSNTWTTWFPFRERDDLKSLKYGE